MRQDHKEIRKLRRETVHQQGQEANQQPTQQPCPALSHNDGLLQFAHGRLCQLRFGEQQLGQQLLTYYKDLAQAPCSCR